jgi:PAS domain S-box-containing protein
MGKRDIDNNILGDIPPASFDTMSADEMRVLLREYQIELEKQKKTANIKRESNDTILSKALIASTELIDENPDGINYQKMTDTVLELSGAQYACFNIFDENGFGFTTIALSGINENIQKVSSFLGFEVINKKWDPDPVRDRLTKDNVINRFKTLHEITGTVIPTPIVTLIVNTFNIGEITLVKIDKNEKRIGDFTLIFAKGDTLQNPEIVELFANQVGMFIDRKRVTNALRANEECNRTILYTAMEGFWIVDLWGNILEVNDTYCQMSGYSIDELLKMRVYDIAITDTPDKTSNRIKSVIEKGALHFESKHRRKDKTIFDAEINLQYRPEEEKIYTFIHDISDRKEAENLLLQTQQNYETFFNTIDDFLFVLDEQGNIIHINNTVTERLGYTFEELFNKFVLIIHPPERREEAGRIVAEMLLGTTEFCPIPIITKSGIQIPVETRVSRGFWDGKPVMFEVTKDISKITLSEEKFSKIFYTNPCASGLSDLINHQYLEVNEAFYTLFGFNKDEVIGKTAYDLKIMTPETRNILLQNADHDGNILNVEVELKAKNGDIKHVIISAENIFVQDRKYRFTVVNDITDRKRAEEALQLQYRLQQLLVNTSTAYINLPLEKLNITLEKSLHDLAIFVGADRSYIFDYDYQHEICLNTYEWCADGIEPQINELQAVPFSELQEWITAHIAGKSICIPDVSSLPFGWGREILEQQNIKSLITVPLMKNEECIGFVGFDSVRKQHNYTDNEQQLLTVFARMLVNIKMRQITENTLRENEQRTRVIFETLSEGIALNEIVYNDNGEMVDYRIIEVNDAFYKITGLTRDAEIIGNVATRLYSMDVKTIKDFWINHLNQKETIITEVFNPLVNRTFSVSTSPIENNRFVTSFQDITELKQIDDIRKESEQRLNRAEKVAQVGNWKLMLDTGKMMSSDGARYIYGVAEDEIPIDLIKTIPLSEYRELLDNALINLIKNGTPYNIDFKIRRVDDGKIRDIHSIAEYDKESNIVFGVIRDVTRRNQLLKTLRNSEENYRTIFNAATEAIFIHDAITGSLLDVNEAMLRLYGYSSKEEVLSCDIKNLSVNMEPYSTENAYKYIRKTMEEGPQSFEWIARKKDGSIFWIEMTLKKTDIDGEGRIIAVGRDITERKHAQELIEKRIVSLTRPLESDIEFDELFNLDEIQRIQGEFALATGVASIITHLDGTPITRPSNFTYLCSEIIRKTERGCANCFKSDAFIGRYHPNGPVVQPCLSGGLFDAGACITVGGRHIANWLIGQVRNESQTEEKMRQYAKEIGADEEELLKAFDRVPGMSIEHFKLIANTLFTLANYLSTGAYQNVQQARFISERKKIEETLRDSEFFFKESQRAASIGSYSTDFTTGYWKSSEVLDQVFGIDESYDRNVPGWLNIVHPDDREMMATYLTEEVLGQRKPFNKEYRITRISDGETRWVHGKGVVTFDENGKVLTLIGTIHDITERKQTEEALRDSEARLSDIIFNTADWVWEVDSKGVYTYSSPQCYDILGITPEEIIGKTPFDFMPIDEATRIAVIFAEIVANKQPIREMENWNIGIDGEKLCLLTDGLPLFDEDGNITGYRGVDKNITERKLAQEALRDSEARYRSILDASPDDITITDMQGRIDMVSSRGIAMFGYKSQDEGVGKLITDFIVPEDRERASANIAIKFKGVNTGPNEYTGIRADGSTFALESNSEFIYNSDGIPTNIVFVIRDITDRKRTEAALIESESKFRNLVWDMHVGVLLQGPQAEILMSNPKALELLGISEDQLLGKTSFDPDWNVIHEDGSLFPGDTHPVPTAIATRTSVNNVVMGVYRPDTGDRVWLLVDAEPELNDDGTVKQVVCSFIDITELKTTEAAMLVSEERFRAISEYSHSAICIVDENAQILWINEKMMEISGFKRAQIMAAESFISFIAPESADFVVSNFMEFVAGHEYHHHYNFYIIRADGEHRLLEKHMTHYTDKHGRRSLIISMLDVTETERAAKALIESEEKFSTAFKASPEAISIIAMKDGTYIDVNDIFLKISGFEKEDIIGRTALDLDFWVDNNERNEYKDRLLKHGFIRNFEAQYKMRFGEIRNFIVSSEVIELDGEKCSLNFIVDISERKKAEQALRENEAKQGKMVANIGDVIVIIDKNGINQYKSPNIERWFGWTPEDVIGKPALDNVHPDDVDAAGKFITSLMTTPDAIGTTECRYRCKDGSYKWIEFTGFNLMNDPDIQGLLGNYQDISERKHAEEEKAKLEAQLQHALKMESVGRLAGGVAHDFNNMLQAILGNADMAKEMTPSDSPLRESLDEICNAAERSADLTRQLLAFARKQTVAPKVLNLNETVDGMIKMLQRLIGENINLSWLPGDGLWSTKVDPSQIDQILANLCVNARDAINGVGKITIETENCFCDEGYCANHIGFEPGSYVHLTVSDNGCGMDKEMMEHIFEPFFTTKGVGEGTGLGLATVYGAVKQNNGYIITYSEPGQGTSFNIYLPRHIGKSEQLAKDGKDGAITKGKETILICEDEATILKLAKMMLQRIGYNVLAANTPGEAVQLAEDYDGDIQVLMTDVIMPEMNGRDLARRIQQIYPNIKRLFMSGYTADVIAHHGILEEGVHFLQKPFSMKELSARVRETIEE